MDVKQLKELLSQREERPWFEFKLKYDLFGQGKGRILDEIAKDILSLANTTGRHAEDYAYLIIGAGNELSPDGSREYEDVRELGYSKGTFLDIVNARCHPQLSDLDYEEINLEGNYYGVITILPSPYVHALARNLDTPKGIWRENDILIRRGDEVAVASLEECELMKQQKTQWAKIVALEAARHSLLEEMAQVMQQYRHKIDEQLKARPFRPWRKHYVIPLSLKELADSTSEEPPSYFKNLSEALQESQRWVLVGEPGSGKSALLERLVIEGSDETWPVFIAARYSESDPILLIQQALNEGGLEASKDTIQTGLDDHRFCLLIDGFDERDEDGRQKVLELCRNLSPRLPIIVSSRKAFYESLSDPEQLPGFGLLQVEPIKSKHIKEYLIDRLGFEQGVADWGAICENRLITIFQTPLNLEMCVEDRQPGQPIPRSKAELLRDYFNKFFSRWEIQKRSSHRGLPIEVEEEILSQIAYFLFKQRKSTAPLSDFQSQLHAIWRDKREDYPYLSSPPNLEDIFTKQGLISRQGKGEIGFTLSTYQDFFLIEGITTGKVSISQTWWEKWQLAVICQALGFDLEAMKFYRRAGYDSKASSQCRITAALYFKNLGDLKTAMELFQLEQERHNPTGYQAHALMLKEQGLFEEAEEKFQQGLQIDPTDGALYQAYGLMLGDLERFGEAEEIFKRGLEVDPSHAPLYVAYSLIKRDQGDFEGAKPLREKSVQLQPESMKSRIHLLRLLFYGLDAVAEAAQIAQDLLAREDIKGTMRAHLRDAANLINWRQKVLTGDAEAERDVRRRFLYARELILYKNYMRAIEELKKVIEQEPEHAEAHWRLGFTLDAQVQPGEGLKYNEKAVFLKPEEPKYRYHLACSALRVDRFDLVHSQLDWLLKRDPKNVEYLCRRGFAFSKAGRWDEAKAAYQVAINLSRTPEDRAKALKNLAQMMISRGVEHGDHQQWEEAWRVLERAWALNPSDPAIFGTRKWLVENLERSLRIDDPYQLVYKRLEPGDLIKVRVYHIAKRGTQVYYYGVPGWLTGDEIRNLRVGRDVESRIIEVSSEDASQSERFGHIEREILKAECISELVPGERIEALVSRLHPVHGIFVNYQAPSGSIYAGLIHRDTLPDPEAFNPKTFPIREGEPIRGYFLDFREEDGERKLKLAWESFKIYLQLTK